MSNNVIEFPTASKERIALTSFGMPRWHCDIHGDHGQVIHVGTVQGERRVYCVACLVDLLDRMGLRNLPPAP